MVVADRLLCRGQNFSKCRVTVDEIAVKINGEWSRLYAAVDIEPELIFAFGRNFGERIMGACRSILVCQRIVSAVLSRCLVVGLGM